MHSPSPFLATGQKIWVTLQGRRCLGEVYQPERAGIVSVRFFSGPGHSWIEEVPASMVERATLFSQQRAWVENGGPTRYLRLVVEVEARHPPLRSYHVAFPNQEKQVLDEDECHAHCECQPIDPFDNLLARGMETPFFFDLRARFVQALVEQRAACRGLTGLLSARIELYRHQVEAIRRILQDPRQRYLLADEVGLGKTIETGIVIRQLRLDHPGARVGILVPARLAPQWREELRDRFSLAADDDPASDLCILPHEKALRLAETVPELIVVDEAHRLIRETTPANLERLGTLFQRVPRLLLVSATPVLGHEHELLHMLSWLEPDVYCTTPDDLRALHHRLEQRQEIGRELLALLPGPGDLDPYPLAGSAERLQALFGGESAPFHDPIVLGRCEELRRLAEQDPLDETAVRRVLLELRLHISECYRLHRRLIRNRRRSLGLTLAERQSPGIEYDLDPDQRRRIWRAFEAWREHLAARAETLPPSQMAAAFRELVQAVGSWASWAATLVRARLGLSHSTSHDPGSLQAIRQVPLQPGERPLLEELLHELDQEGPLTDRVRLLVKLFELETIRGKMPRKTVVFTAATTVCLELARRLGQSLQRPPAVLHAGQSADEAQQQVDHFRTDEACQVLVCDRTGEEGRNFQFAGRLVHFDLPLDPFAIEQRIGRLDRLSRVARTLPSVVLLGDAHGDGFDEHWFRLLDEGFRVFTGPISDLHLHVEQELPRLLQGGFLQGRQAWSEAVAQVRQDIERERQNNREQDILDAVELDAELSAQFFRRLEEYEDDVEPFRRAVTGYLEWVNKIDLFEYRRLSVVRRHQYHDWNNVLLRRDWFDQISPHLAEQPAWDRPDAQRHPERPFLRLGHPLVDLLERFSREDDRGQAFLMWRVRREQVEPEVYCRLHYVIEAGREALRAQLAGLPLPPGREPELLRLADLFFPPRVEVLFLQENLEPVRDVSLRELLRRDYDKDAGDVNLGNPDLAGVLDQHIGAGRWANLCRSLREAAVWLIEDDPAHRDACRQAEQDLDAFFTRRREQLALALQHADRAARDAQLAVEQAIQTALEQAVRRPAIRPDAVGVILLAGGPCP